MSQVQILYCQYKENELPFACIPFCLIPGSQTQCRMVFSQKTCVTAWKRVIFSSLKGLEITHIIFPTVSLTVLQTLMFLLC